MTGPPPERPAVSCVMIFLDGVRFIEEAIRSVVEQPGFDDWELHPRRRRIDRRQQRHRARAGRRLIRCGSGTSSIPGHENRGMSASRNPGCSAAAGEYVSFLDCDDVWLPPALAHRMRVAAAHPTADVVVGGTWRWHSWYRIRADLGSDVPMPLPDRRRRTRRWTRLGCSYAIYGIPGGGHVPAMCSLRDPA